MFCRFAALLLAVLLVLAAVPAAASGADPSVPGATVAAAAQLAGNTHAKAGTDERQR